MQVTVFNTQTNQPSRITSTATTWGQLKAELTSQRISFSNMKVMVKETKVTLESDEATLPTSDYTLFLFPQQVKSGRPVTPDELSEQIDNFEEYTTARMAEIEQKLDRVLSALSTRGGVASYSSQPTPQVDHEAAKLAAEAAQMLKGSQNPYSGW